MTMTPRVRCCGAIVRGLTLLCLMTMSSGKAPAGLEGIDPPPPAREPTIAAASAEPAGAAAGFGLPEGFRAELFAAEPDLANPVAFSIDERGRVYACEAFRTRKGVADNNGTKNIAWLHADLAARTVDDRLAYHLRLLGDEAREWVVETDRLRLLDDTDGDGRADRATVFATGFNRLIEGHGAGVLGHHGDVFYACIPNLWRLRDTDGDGVADDRTVLHTGYGVRVAFHGHDLHGLTLGPDGLIYFSVGDRGYHVVHEGGTLADPESGAVFRCAPDGSGLEVVHTGLRNPQELAFDDLGNLFTVDNNSDSGDRARLVQIVPGGDSGWRMSVQYLPDRGPFNRERLWHLAHDGQPAWIVPPLAHIGSGPSGFAACPGTGLPPHFDGRFLLADFRGAAATSCVRTFRLRPSGASFEACDEEETFRHVLATDVEVGPDGAVWVSDWVHGWQGEGKGRLWRFVPTAGSVEAEAARTAAVAEVRGLLAGDWSALTGDRLVALLAHRDRRLRLESQWELARRADGHRLESVLTDPTSVLSARVHAIQGLAQLAAGHGDSPASIESVLITQLSASAWEARMVAARSLGDLRSAAAAVPLTRLLADVHAHVRATAARALGRSRVTDGPTRHAVTAAVVAAIGHESAAAEGFDPHARNALVTALAGVAEPAALRALAAHAEHPVRLAACLAMRRRLDPAITVFLADPHAPVALEAARAIHDVPIPAATAALAARLDDCPVDGVDGDAFLRRAIAASERQGTAADVERLVRFLARPDAPIDRLLDAAAVLRDWQHPPKLDRVLGMWRPCPQDRDATVARDGLGGALPRLLEAATVRPDAGERVTAAVLEAAAALGVPGIAPLLAALCEDASRSASMRAAALRALAATGAAEAVPLAVRLSTDAAAPVRIVARQVRATAIASARAAGTDAAAAAEELARELSDACTGDVPEEARLHEQQAAIDLLATLDAPTASRTVDRLAAGLVAGGIDPRVALEVAEARDAKAGRKLPSPGSAPTPDLLYGGDAARGRELFFHKATIECVRCHRVEGRGGDVGPRLDGIAARRDRAYLLESVLQPSSSFADGYRTTVLVMNDGRTVAGIARAETPDELTLVTADGRMQRIPTAAIEDRSDGASAMPADLASKLTRRELRDLVAWLASLTRAE